MDTRTRVSTTLLKQPIRMTGVSLKTRGGGLTTADIYVKAYTAGEGGKDTPKSVRTDLSASPLAPAKTRACTNSARKSKVPPTLQQSFKYGAVLSFHIK